MRIPGFNRPDREPALAAAGQGYLERRPGESAEAFEMRMAAAAREREAARPPVWGRRQPKAATRPDERRPERTRRRRGFGMIGLAVTLVAVLGALWLVLAAREGSFAAGGALVDQKLAEVTSPARVAATQAVDRTGAAVQSAGQALETQGQKIRKAGN
jgi:hypothetical protein